MPSSLLLRRLVATTTAVFISVAGVGVTASSASASIADPGTVIGWGYNYYGQSTAPVSLQGKDVIAVSANYVHSMALTSDGTVTGWGYAGFGQNNIPESLGGKRVTAIAAGYYSDLALTSDGEVTAWGTNQYGTTDVPTSLADKNVTAIAAGELGSMALTDDGQVTVWGYNYDGITDVPASLASKNVTAIAAGQVGSMALTDDGHVTAWGYNYYGENDVPASLADKTVTAIAAGGNSRMALTSDGKVTVWGSNDYGQNDVPAGLADKNVIAIRAGGFHDVALTDDGTVVAWGYNGYGETNVPSDLANVTQISAGYVHNLVIVGGDIAPGDFSTGVTATVTGTPKVGSTLTAGGGDVAPAADSFSYRWFADDVVIADATEQSFTPTGAQRGAKITVEVTAVKAGYTDSTDLSDPTAAVAAGSIGATGSVTVSGTPQVGETLTGSSTLETTPDADTSGQWLRDGVVIDGATDTAYDLTNPDAGATITYQVSASVEGYDDATYTSDGMGPVDGGVITLPAPSVTGTPVVDGTLTASLSDATLDPTDADVTYEWTRGATVVGSGSTYAPTADDAAQTLTVTATATRTYFDDATSSTRTAEVAQAGFTTGPTATITGTLKVGETLTADGGAVAPAPDGLEYQWYADHVAIAGADSSTLALTPAQKHRSISVEVTAVKAGYASMSDTSANTAGIATNLAPALDLAAAASQLRRGESTSLTWTSAEANRLTASGGWTGARRAAGTVTVRPTSLGGTTYVLRATNANGTTAALVNLQVRRAAKVFSVAATNGLRLRGSKVTVSAAGLGSGESFVIRIGGTTVARGKASASGRVVRTVRIPSDAAEGRTRVAVRGSEPDRSGADTLRVVRNKVLGLRLAKKQVRASDDQTVTVTGLASREKVAITYQGRRISPKGAHANSRGRYTRSFGVDIYWGTKSVRAIGQYSGRRATRTFEVVRRCRVGHVCA